MTQLRKKILLVDDDEDILFLVRFLLIKAGFDVCTHSTGLGVSTIVDGFAPDLILLDIMLPGLPGTEVCKELKQTHSMPIILFSAHAKQDYPYQEWKADGFFQKPFEIDTLVEYVGSYLN